jgi:hypothetical protein
VLPLLATAAINDWLQTGFTTLCAGANLAQKEAGAPPREAGRQREERFRHSPPPGR